MILYLDTSSLVKLYIEEAGSAEVRREAADSDVLATSVVALPEARSAFAKLSREGPLTAAELSRVRGAFLRDWDFFLKLQMLERVYERAGNLAEKYALRGFDAVHLASFAELLEGAEGSDIRFSAFDRRLSSAADALQSERMDG